MVVELDQRVSDLKNKEDQLHTSLDNLRGDRKRIKEYRAIDKELKSIVRKRQNLEAAKVLSVGMFVTKPSVDKSGVIKEILITSGGHAEVWVSWDGGKTPVPEQPELLIIDKQCNLQLDTVLREEVGIRGEPLPPDINPCGQSSQISTPLPSIEKDSPKPNLLKQTLELFPTNLLLDSQNQTCLSSDRLAAICPPLAQEPDLMAIAQACFLKQSDFCDYSSLKVSCLKMFQDYSVATIEPTLNRLSHPSLNWGIAFPGSLATDTDGFPKTEKESLFWVLSGNVQCTRIDPNRLTLQQCLENGVAIIHKARGGDRIYTELAPTLRSLANTNGHQSGNGAWKVKTADGIVRPLLPTECERLMGWEVVKENITIEVWNVPCVDPLSNCADAARQCLKKPSAVGSAEKTEKNELVSFAATSFWSENHNEPKPAEVLVDYNLEDKGIVLRTTLTSPLSVPIAELQRVLDRQKSDAFALANAFIYLIQAKTTVNGKAELLTSEKALEAHLNGRICVEKYGRIAEENVNAVVKCINQAKNFSRFTISAVGASSQNCDLSLQTLSCFVANVIDGFIPEQIRSKSSYVLKIEYSVGCTKYGLTEDGRVIEISNTQRQKMLGNGIVPQEIEDICNNLRPFLEEMKSNTTVCSQTEPDNETETNYGILEELLPTKSLVADGGTENNKETSAMDHHTISGTVVAAKNFSVGDRVKSISPIFPDTVCTISALPSSDAAIIELENGARERLLVEHLEPLNGNPTINLDVQANYTRFEILEELSPDEEKERYRLELKVDLAFYEAGRSLATLRDRRLYRSTHKTFEEYCKERFGFTRQSASLKILAAEVIDDLSTNGCQILPNSERQVRPIIQAGLQPHEQRSCWQQAVDLADGKVPTGKIVKGVVERLKEKPLNYASEYCSVGEIFTLQRLTDEQQKYNGWWGIAMEVENRFTVKCQVYDTTIEIRQENIKRVDMTTDETVKQQEIIERVSRLARCNLDPAIWALLEVVNSQSHVTQIQLDLLTWAEQRYKINSHYN